MRKIVVLGLALVLILGLALSAGAITSSGTTDGIRYSALTFDTIEFDGIDKFTYSLPFPFTSTASSYGGITEFSYCDDFIYGYQGTADDDKWFPSIFGDITLAPASPDIGEYMQIYLHGGQQIFKRSRVEDYYISWDTEDIQVANVHVSGLYYRIVEAAGSSYYGAELVSFDFDVPVVNGIARIGETIDDYFYNLDPNASFIFLDCISVELDFTRKSVATTSFDFNIPVDGQGRGRPNSHVDLNNWMYERKILISKAEVSGDFDATSWLSTAVGGFLDFEIAPGFSIDKIFYIILVVGVLLWFIKIIS